MPTLGLEEFLYFDEEGVDSLFNQYPAGRLERYTAELSGGSERSRTGKAKLGLGGLTKLLAMPSFDVEGERGGKKTRGERRSEEFVMTKEARYRQVVERLGGVAAVKRGLTDAWHRALAADFGDMFICEARFCMPPAGGVTDKWRIDANTSGMLQMQDAQDRMFTLGMRTSKLIGMYDGEIQQRGHFAIRMNRNDGVHLRIFGKMDRSRYIKPFVVSW